MARLGLAIPSRCLTTWYEPKQKRFYLTSLTTQSDRQLMFGLVKQTLGMRLARHRLLGT